MASTAPTTISSEHILIVPIPGKGIGVIARKTIPPGTILIQEGPIMPVPVPGQVVTEEHLTEAFSTLSPSKQQSVLSLSANKSGEGSLLRQIFTSNSFGDDNSCWLHPTISRINHSCVPNTTTVRDPCCIGDACQIIADREIEAGEEMTFCYNFELYELMTSSQRAKALQQQYGFKCDCVACVPGEFQRLSDGRRILIKGIRKRLHGLETSGFENTDGSDDYADGRIWVRSVEVEKKLSAEEKTILNLLLAGLRQAEGLEAQAIAQNYWQASEAMLEQIQAMGNVVILSWAGNVQTWMEHAIEVMTAVRSPFDHDPQKLREVWETVQMMPCMRVAMGFMDGSLEVHVKGWHRPSAFAIQIVKGKLKVLSRAECSAVLNGIGTISPVPQDDDMPKPIPDTKNTKTSRIPHGLLGASNKLKVAGAALTLTCAAPVAAWWIMR